MEERELRERFVEKFGNSYVPDNWDVEYEGSVGITFESLMEECTQAWNDEEILRSAFKSPEFFTNFVIGQLEWTYPSTLIHEIIMDLTEEDDDDDQEEDLNEYDLKIAAAKKVLRNDGYIVDSLWSTRDVQAKYESEGGEEIRDDVANTIMAKVLASPSVYDVIWESMAEAAREYNLKEKVMIDREYAVVLANGEIVSIALVELLTGFPNNRLMRDTELHYTLYEQVDVLLEMKPNEVKHFYEDRAKEFPCLLKRIK